MILINIDSRLQSLPNYLVGHYKNIVLTRADFANLVNNTPLAKIFQKSSHTKYFLNNISDIIRVVLLWQFGGTYLDSDVISLKPVPDQASHCWNSFNPKTNLVYLTMSQFHTGDRGCTNFEMQMRLFRVSVWAKLFELFLKIILSLGGILFRISCKLYLWRGPGSLQLAQHF